ncbi:MAG: 50S ribosomal protein L18 [Deltaproteobacteria bacterium]|nr:50S ribosomal protein L18 [Deltaproteobacteria bacterium]
MPSSNDKNEAHLRRKKRVRKKIYGRGERPRLSVFRSARHIYVQVIDDVSGATLVAASSLGAELKNELKHGGNVEAAKKVGSLIAKKALAKGIEKVAFDRNGFIYHGRVKALADAARESGLKF